MGLMDDGRPGNEPFGTGISFDPTPVQPYIIPSGKDKWKGLLTAGILFIFIGFIQLAIISSVENDSSFDFGGGFDSIAYAIPAAALIGGFIMIALSFWVRDSEIFAREQQELAEKERRIVQERHEEEHRQEMIRAIKSTIKIRCRYCGTLNDEGATRCESCGGNL